MKDLITLRPGREYAWLDRAIEKGLRWTPRPLKALPNVSIILRCPKPADKNRSGCFNQR